jgi:uncharacterized protein (DUF2225 family)
VIGKDQFGQLLEHAPNMASDILSTLRSRAEATAEAVREAGKEAPELPPLLKIVQYRDAKSSLVYMTMLADIVRRMNSLLVSGAEPPKALEQAFPQDAVKLLPEGYLPFGVTDDKNNWGSLRVLEAVCPYCFKTLDAYAPMISLLDGRRGTLDGRVVYHNLNILLYTNIICPNCNYSDTYLEFSKPRKARKKPAYEGNQFANEENFTGYAASRSHTLDEAILSYYLNIECLKRTSNDPLRLANAWIRLYWLYSDQKSKKFAAEAAKHARRNYAKYLNDHTNVIPLADRMRLHAILGEMSVAIGDYRRALECYMKNTAIGKGTKDDLLKESLRRCKEIKKMM